MRFLLPILALAAVVSAGTDFYAVFFNSTNACDSTISSDKLAIIHPGFCTDIPVDGDGSVLIYYEGSKITGWSGAGCSGDAVFEGQFDGQPLFEPNEVCLALGGVSVASWSETA